MDKLDGFISSGGFVQENLSDDSSKNNSNIVVYNGGNSLGPNLFFPGAEKLIIDYITDVSEIRNMSKLEYVLALSDNDFENLVLSSIAKSQNDKIQIGAVCNDIKNKRLFHMMDITILSPEELTYEYFYSITKTIESKQRG